MSYEPTEWKNGDIITSEKLNNIETGVRSMNSEYVPTEWKNGDVITAEKLNNIEQGITNGGSSDFSTAEVTFVPNVLGEWFANFIIPAILPGGEYFVNDTSYADLSVNNSDYTPITIILYKGCARGTIYSDDADISVSGNAVLDGNDITITGDCTITFSAKH